MMGEPVQRACTSPEKPPSGVAGGLTEDPLQGHLSLFPSRTTSSCSTDAPKAPLSPHPERPENCSQPSHLGPTPCSPSPPPRPILALQPGAPATCRRSPESLRCCRSPPHPHRSHRDPRTVRQGQQMLLVCKARARRKRLPWQRLSS